MSGYHEICHTPYGVCIINKYDQYVSRSLRETGGWCVHELELLRQLIPQRGVVVEAGANYGAHTLAFADYVGPEGRVYAFEPQRIVYQALCGSAALNSLGNILAINAATGDTAGWIDVPQPNYGAQSNFGGVSLAKQTSDAAKKTERVALVTIDQLDLPSCSLIKADVEGMEAAVVRGGLATIKRFRPALYLENHDDERRQPLISLCRGLGYDLYWHGSELDPNMLCLPSERGITVGGLTPVSGDSWR